MPQLILYGNEQIRINQAKNHIEVSTTRGANWYTRYSGSGCGEFRDLIVYGTELIALTSKGIYVSTSKGASWYCRCSSSTCHTSPPFSTPAANSSPTPPTATSTSAPARARRGLGGSRPH